MDDIVVIILTLIILIIGIAGKTKRKNIRQPAENQSYRPNNLWDFLNSLEQAPVQQNIEITEESPVLEEKSDKKPSLSFNPKDEGGSILQRKTSKEKENLNEPMPNKNDKTERFSLRKAVIYSEILNRKYT